MVSNLKVISCICKMHECEDLSCSCFHLLASQESLLSFSATEVLLWNSFFDWRPAKQVLLASSTLVLLTIIQKKLCNKPNFKSLYFLSDCEMQSLTFLSQNIYGIIARGGWLVGFATWKVLGDNLPMLIKTSVFLNFQSNKKWDHLLSPPLFS